MLFVFDVDGTLAPPMLPIDFEVAGHLRTLEARGHSICFASGRPHEYLLGLARGCGIRRPLVIGENGALVCDFCNLILHTLAKAPPSLAEIKSLVQSNFSEGEVYFQGNIVALTVFFKNDEIHIKIRELLKKNGFYEDISITIFDHADCFDILPSGASKGAALAFLAKQLSTPKSQIIAVGDGENDVSLFYEAGEMLVVGDLLQSINASHRFATTAEMLGYLTKSY